MRVRRSPGHPRCEPGVTAPGLIQILEVPEFGSTDIVHAPMTAALAPIKQYRTGQANRIKCYALGEQVPAAAGTRGHMP